MSGTLPDYWMSEVTASVNTVLSNINKIKNSSSNTPRTSTFFFITDTHWRGNAKNSSSAALQVAEAIDLAIDNDNNIPASFKTRLNANGYRKLIFAGDSIKGNAGTKDGARAEAGAFLDAWDSSFHLATALGNHDTNKEGSNPTENRLTSDEMYDLFLARESGYVTRDDINKDTYIGWFDDAANKIRYFTFRHYDSTNLSSAVWTKFNAAIDEIKNDGWGAIFFCHTFWGLSESELVPDTLNIPSGSVEFASMLTDTCCDNGVVPIALMVGHIHTDNSYILTTNNSNKLLVTSTVCDTYVNERATIVPAPVMNAGDTSEQAFEVVQIDMNAGKLYLTRVGAGFDRVFNIPAMNSNLVPVINPEIYNEGYNIMSVKFINLENLSDFWSNAKEYINNERQEIEDQLYNWQKTEKAPIVQCEPVPNSELHPVVNFSFTETLPTEGEKGPSNPSTISGINNITVVRYGKNAITFPYTETSSFTRAGITYTTASDGSITVNGTATDRSAFYIIGQSRKRRYYIGDVITISGTPANAPEGCRLLFERNRLNNSYIGNYQITNSNLSYTFTAQDEGYFGLSLVINSGVTVSNIVFKPQLEYNSIATPFEPLETVIATINLNNTYYGGSVDLSTGQMTVTWKGIVYTGEENVTYTSTTPDNLYQYNLPAPSYTSGYGAAYFSCTHFNPAINNGETFYVRGSGGAGVRIYVSEYATVDAVKAWLAAQYANGTPVTVVYQLAIPETVQLIPQQIKSLPSLEGTSKRINTIYTDADSIQVEYQKYVGIDSTLDSNSVNAIQNKVVNNALNTKVSLSGDETINGTKTFSNTINGNITGDAGTVAGHIVSKDVPVNAAFTDTTYDPATQSTAGLMSASDKAKLDAVGSVFSFKGSVVNSSSLPASDNVNGDAYLAEDTGHVHIYDGTNFVDIGVWAGIPSATDAQIDALFED